MTNQTVLHFITQYDALFLEPGDVSPYSPTTTQVGVEHYCGFFCFLLYVLPVTVNVDIFACINFRGFMKMGNFEQIRFRVLCIIGSLG